MKQQLTDFLEDYFDFIDLSQNPFILSNDTKRVFNKLNIENLKSV